MIALADQIVADGMNPFCFGMYSNGATGWLATDWMEDVMLRTGGGTATYDQWVNHEIPFNDPVVKNAAEYLSQIMHTPDYVVGGTDAIVSTFFGNAQDPMFERDADGNPGCLMHRQASFIVGFWPEDAQPGAGTETTVFPFPVIDPSLPKAALGGGDMWAVQQMIEMQLQLYSSIYCLMMKHGHQLQLTKVVMDQHVFQLTLISTHHCMS